MGYSRAGSQLLSRAFSPTFATQRTQKAAGWPRAIARPRLPQIRTYVERMVMGSVQVGSL